MTDAPVCVAASGLSYSEQEELIEKIARSKAYQHRTIGFYEPEDLMQEVRIKCWSAIPRFKPSEGTNIYVFLSVCAENRIRDIKRSVMYKHNKPCMRCPFWNSAAAGSGLHDCLVYDNKMGCERFAKHERYVQAKLSASHPVDINNERLIDESSGENETKLELIDYVETHLPECLVPIFRKFQRNNYNPKALKPRERTLILEALRQILSEYEMER